MSSDQDLVREVAPTWCVVVVLRTATDDNRAFLTALSDIATTRENVRVVFVASDAIQGAFPKVDIVTVSAEDGFNYCSYANMGAARHMRSRRYLFVHDDCSVDDMAGLLDVFDTAMDAGALALAVPVIGGRCCNPAQVPNADWESLPYFETSEYIDPCCVAVDRVMFWNAGPWDDWLDGYDFWQVDLQAKFARRGMSACVVPGATVRHGDGVFMTERRPETFDSRYRNLLRFGARNNVRIEAKRRPSEVRLTTRRGDGARHARTLCFVCHDESDEPAVLELCRSALEYGPSATSADDERFARTANGCDEVCIISKRPMTNIRQRVRDVYRSFGRGVDVRYSPFTDLSGIYSSHSANPEYWQVVGLADGSNVLLVDVRDLAPPATESVETKFLYGPRVRFGDRYALPQTMTRLDIGMVDGMGIGDTLMATAAIHAFKRRFPHVGITVRHGWDAAHMLTNNPDIEFAYIHRGGEPLPPNTTTMTGIGVEGTLRHHFEALSIEPETDADRRVVYVVSEEERDDAIHWLHRVGCEDNPYAVGVQLHGNWQVKQWSGTEELVRRLLDLDATVLAYGSDTSRQPPLPEDPRIILCTNQPLRRACAVIGLLDAFVGFDSGFAFVAGALGTPSVTLWGPNDPRGFILDTDPENAVCIRVRNPLMCEQEFGHNCRRETGGSRCPMRPEGAPGGLCLDEISPEQVIAELSKLPRWGQSLSMRRRL